MQHAEAFSFACAYIPRITPSFHPRFILLCNILPHVWWLLLISVFTCLDTASRACMIPRRKVAAGTRMLHMLFCSIHPIGNMQVGPNSNLCSIWVGFAGQVAIVIHIKVATQRVERGGFLFILIHITVVQLGWDPWSCETFKGSPLNRNYSSSLNLPAQRRAAKDAGYYSCQ